MMGQVSVRGTSATRLCEKVRLRGPRGQSLEGSAAKPPGSGHSGPVESVPGGSRQCLGRASHVVQVQLFFLALSCRDVIKSMHLGWGEEACSKLFQHFAEV